MFTNTLCLASKLKFPKKKALIFDDCAGNVTHLTYEELKDTINNVKEVLTKASIKKGDRVIFISSNHLFWMPIFIGVAGYGAIIVPIDENIAIERFKSIIEDGSPTAIITSTAIEPRLTEFNLKDKTVFKIADMAFELFLTNDNDEEPVSSSLVTPEDIATIIYTSGTTGKPKGIMLSHKAIISAIKHGCEMVNYKTDDIMLSLLPFTHVFSLIDSALVQLHQNSTVVMSQTLNPASVMKLIFTYSITFIIAVPRLADLLAFGIKQANLKLPPIKLIIGGAACRPKILQMLQDAGVIPMQGFGMTETCAGIVIRADGPIESVGKPFGEIMLKIDSKGNKEGELLIKSPTLFSGVWGCPELRQSLFDGEYFRSGDLASIDENGYVFIKGRAKEVIISGTGINVYPDELEMRLGILPFATDFAVFGLKEGDIEFPALVFLAKNEFFKDINMDKAEDYANEEIQKLSENWPIAEKIKKIYMVDKPLPCATNGKVKRYQLTQFLNIENTCTGIHKKNTLNKNTSNKNTENALFEIFKQEAANFLHVTPDKICRETKLNTFVQLDSLGIISMLVNLEKKFKVSFGDLVGTPLKNFGQLIDFLHINMNDEKLAQIESNDENDLNMPPLLDFSADSMSKRLEFLQKISQDESISFPTPNIPEAYSGNIEGLVGFSQMPIGLAGPLKVDGLHAKDEFYIPLATTEGALISSVARGCQAITKSGGAEVRIVCDSVVRTPVFIFPDITNMFEFGIWIKENFKQIKEASETTTRHGKLLDIEQFPIGSKLILRFSYSTGDASGQNMTTIATRTAVDYILKSYPGKVTDWFLESNLSGDKKINGLNFTRNRGKKIIAQVTIPKRVVIETLHTTPERMRQLAELAMITSLQAHSFGVQAHFANVLAAMYIATGQDPACVAESAAGITYLELVNGDLQISTTLPGIMVGTVGGGTRLPTQNSCLKILGCAGTGHAAKFAEILAATVLAGEISLIGAMAADEFTDAHAKYGRAGGLNA